MNRLIALLFAFVFCAVSAGMLLAEDSAAPADNAAEDDFFGSGSVETKDNQAEVKNMAEQLDTERVGLSGNMQASSSYTMTRDFFRGIGTMDNNSWANAVQGDFLVDARLKKNFRAFVDLNLGYLSPGVPVPHTFTTMDNVITLLPGTTFQVTESPSTLLLIKEVFVDFNLANTVYFRAGKQVLQWGRGYLWTPTDLINIQRKSFMNLNALREGVLGLRTDIVFAREFHFYTFLDFNSIDTLSNVAGAGRAEFLVGATEFGVSAWAKQNKIPAFGLDVSTTPFWNIVFYAEGAFSWGSDIEKMRTDGSTYFIRGELVPRISAGLSRSFDAWDVNDRIQVNAEFYYNGAGYDENMFQALSPTNLANFFARGDYTYSDYGRYYGALFVTINKFFVDQLTLTLSGLGNFSDLSFIPMASLAWSPVNNFTLNFQVATYLGPDQREFTAAFNQANGSMGNNMLTASIYATVAF